MTLHRVKQCRTAKVSSIALCETRWRCGRAAVISAPNSMNTNSHCAYLFHQSTKPAVGTLPPVRGTVTFAALINSLDDSFASVAPLLLSRQKAKLLMLADHADGGMSGPINQSRWPANADEEAIWPGDSALIQPPFSMSKHASGSDDQVVHQSRYSLNIWRADEDAERVVRCRDGPGAVSCLGKVNLATPSGHDDIMVLAACASKAKTLPKWDGRWKVVTRNNGESADAGFHEHIDSVTYPCRARHTGSRTAPQTRDRRLSADRIRR